MMPTAAEQPVARCVTSSAIPVALLFLIPAPQYTARQRTGAGVSRLQTAGVLQDRRQGTRTVVVMNRG